MANETLFTNEDNVMETFCRLTTLDNPFDPFDDFLSWWLFDIEHGYNTCGYLDRVSNIKDDMTQKEINEEIERAIDEIILLNPLNIYKKVKKEVPVAM